MRLLAFARSRKETATPDTRKEYTYESWTVNAACDLLCTAVDLTRACCANDNYLLWLSQHSDALRGSGGIANYLGNAALAFEEQAHPQLCPKFDVFEARDNLADLLMASAPLACDELRAAVTAAICEAKADASPLSVYSARLDNFTSPPPVVFFRPNRNGNRPSEVAR